MDKVLSQKQKRKYIRIFGALIYSEVSLQQYLTTKRLDNHKH